jgi:hypothetical protein
MVRRYKPVCVTVPLEWANRTVTQTGWELAAAVLAAALMWDGMVTRIERGILVIAHAVFVVVATR